MRLTQVNHQERVENNWYKLQSESEIIKSLALLKKQTNKLWKLHELSYDVETSEVNIYIKVKRSELRKLKKFSPTIHHRVKRYLVGEVLRYINPNILAQHLSCKIEIVNWFYHEVLFDDEIHNSKIDYLEKTL